jgi:hypothetical protein
MTLRKGKLILAVGLMITVVSVVLAFRTPYDRDHDSLPAAANLRKQDEPEGEANAATLTVLGESDLNRAVALFTIRPRGFEPRQVTLPAGAYLVVVRNRTGLDQFALRLERESGETLYDVQVPRGKRDWKQFLLLIPGSYILKETNNPAWICRITVIAS